MSRKLAIVSLLLILIVSSMTFSLTTVQAAVPVKETTGRLGDANYIVQIPENWNGRLVVCCRGYSHLLSDVNLRFYANGFAAMVQMGYGFAISDYGSGGYCIKEAMIRTHQLTEYVIDNFDVTGKVYLVGISMGGNVALMLGAKYPDLYAGVLEIAGTKDVEARTVLHSTYADMTDDSALGAAVVANGGKNPPYPCTAIGIFRTYCTWSVADVIAECKGTLDKKPQAYDRISAIESATDIAIPTITIHGTADGLVPFSQSVDFLNAVNAAGHGSLYRLYKVDGGEHCDGLVMGQIPAKFFALKNWAEMGTLPLPSSY